MTVAGTVDAATIGSYTAALRWTSLSIVSRFTLHDGVPTKKDNERLKNEDPKQEVGRLSYKELT